MKKKILALLLAAAATVSLLSGCGANSGVMDTANANACLLYTSDRRSANTQHLAEICRQNCSRVLQIESADELSTAEFAGCRVAGLTAGASTPAGIIKEVKTTMSEEIKSTEGMEESFEELLNQSFKTHASNSISLI